ncbi:PACE efflux transporter [Thalassospira alkalitolerans]|uniref:PACE efflux transporter n=1 Tax=Thalassospira alkalitolerans TaxID=1293890 RepID=UPI003AA9378B
MRTIKDRIRHAISFEIIGLVIITPLAAWLFDMPLHNIGVVALVSATIAAGWNYLYNLIFDHVMKRIVGHVQKTLLLRVLHVMIFEGGLLVLLLPFIAWYLGIPMMQAFLMDASFTLFFMGYAFAFNWAYDLVFPIKTRDDFVRTKT